MGESFHMWVPFIKNFGILPIMPIVLGYPCSVPGYPWSVPACPESVPKEEDKKTNSIIQQKVLQI